MSYSWSRLTMLCEIFRCLQSLAFTKTEGFSRRLLFREHEALGLQPEEREVLGFTSLEEGVVVC